MKIKEERGSMAVYVTIVLLSMLFILTAVFLITNALRKNQIETTLKVKESYEKDVSRADKIYDSLTGNNQPGDGPREVDGVTIPDGFYYVGGEKNDGIVISDEKADLQKGTSHETAQTLQGNQFVWVPVEDTSTMFAEETVKLNGVETTTNVYSKLRIRQGENYKSVKPGNTSSAREPDLLSNYDTDSKYYKTILGYNSTKEMADAFVAEYKAMYESVKKYKGFYIGRYELSGNVSMPTSKAGPVLTASNSQAENWYKLKKICSEMIKGKECVNSIMIYGCQWDETMNWLITSGVKTSNEVNQDSSNWGNYNGSKQSTGTKKEWSANHIYDLAGNYGEWTQEARYIGGRFFRGGIYNNSGSEYPASSRFFNNPHISNENYTCRVTLCIK